MKDPITLSVAAAAGGVGASLGTVIGIPVESLIAGLVGGLVAIYAMPSPRPEGQPAPTGLALYLALAASIFVSVACAGFIGPFTAAWINAPTIEDHLELKVVSFLWGAGAQAGLLATAIAALRRRIEQLGGIQ